jgi:hypothetical protein
MNDRPIRQSIQPTYDSRETGDRYHVTTFVDDRVISWRTPIADPFVRQTVRVHWRDLLRGLRKGGLKVEVQVFADIDVINDVMELDANTLLPNSTRRAEWDAGMNQRLVRASKEAEAASGDEEPW